MSTFSTILFYLNVKKSAAKQFSNSLKKSFFCKPNKQIKLNQKLQKQQIQSNKLMGQSNSEYLKEAKACKNEFFLNESTIDHQKKQLTNSFNSNLKSRDENDILISNKIVNHLDDAQNKQANSVNSNQITSNNDIYTTINNTFPSSANSSAVQTTAQDFPQKNYEDLSNISKNKKNPTQESIELNQNL